jgi:hypothetical protein
MLDVGEQSASHPGHFTPGKSTHWIGGQVGSRAGLDAVDKRYLKMFAPNTIQAIIQHGTKSLL